MSRNSIIQPVAAFCAVIVTAAPVSAQSLFQEAPGPTAPSPRPRPRLRPAPQPAPEPAPEPLPPAPVVTAPALPPAAPPSLAGKWTAKTNCPLGDTVELDVEPIGREQYRIVIPQDARYSGWISGKIQHAESTGLFGDRLSFNGTVTSPTTMSGKTHLGFAGIDCDWWATKN